MTVQKSGRSVETVRVLVSGVEHTKGAVLGGRRF
jgi:hypothetical protein